MSVLLDVLFVVLFFVDGRSDLSAYLNDEFAAYDGAKSVSDLLLLCVVRDVGLLIAYRSVGVLRSAVPAIVVCALSCVVALVKGVVVVVVTGHALSSVRVVMIAFAFTIGWLDLLVLYAVRDALLRSAGANALLNRSSINGADSARARLTRLARGQVDDLAPLLVSQSPAPAPLSPPSSSPSSSFAPRHSAFFAGSPQSRPEERFAQSQQRRFSAPSAALPLPAPASDVDEVVRVAAAPLPVATPPSASKPVRPSLARLCERMSRRDTGVAIGDRYDALKTHKQCFVGCEAIDWMCLHLGHLFPSRRLALDCAQELLVQRFVVSATCQCSGGACDCTFRDSTRSFYRWQQGWVPEVLPQPSAPIAVGGTSAAADAARSPAVAMSASPAVAMANMDPLTVIASYAARSVTVGDRLVQLSAESAKKFVAVFPGRALVDFFMGVFVRHERYLAEKRVPRTEFRVGTPTGDALIGDETIWRRIDSTGSNRDAAVRLGQALLDERMIFHSADGRQFVDGEVLFSFQPTKVERVAFDAPKTQTTKGAAVAALASPGAAGTAAASAPSSAASKVRVFSAVELDGLARALSSPSVGLVREAAFQLSDSETRTYTGVFSVTDAIRWLTEHSLSKENAIRALIGMWEAGLIRHAANESKGVVPREGEFYRFAASVMSPPVVDGAPGAPAVGV